MVARREARDFGALKNGAWQVSSAPISGERPQTAVPGAWAAAESLDGRWLSFVRLDWRGLWRRPADNSGTDSLISSTIQAEDWPNLCLTAAGIFFVARPDDGDPMLMALDRDGAAPRSLTRLPEFAWNGIAV